MPTQKHRINISVSPQLNRALITIAKRDHVPIATKATRLLELALDIEEDEILGRLAAEREATADSYLTHEEVWGR